MKQLVWKDWLLWDIVNRVVSLFQSALLLAEPAFSEDAHAPYYRNPISLQSVSNRYSIYIIKFAG